MYEGKTSGRNQEHDVEALLIRMEEAVSSARNVPFSDNCMVDREEMLLLLSMIRENLPGELKQARWLLQQNKQLIAEARKEAENIMRETESRMARMVDEHEITQQARQQAAQIIEDADINSRQIRGGAWSMPATSWVLLKRILQKCLLPCKKTRSRLNKIYFYRSIFCKWYIGFEKSTPL
jgi:cell division septum initiation protein DivIVA